MKNELKIRKRSEILVSELWKSKPTEKKVYCIELYQDGNWKTISDNFVFENEVDCNLEMSRMRRTHKGSQVDVNDLISKDQWKLKNKRVN